MFISVYYRVITWGSVLHQISLLGESRAPRNIKSHPPFLEGHKPIQSALCDVAIITILRGSWCVHTTLGDIRATLSRGDTGHS